MTILQAGTLVLLLVVVVALIRFNKDALSSSKVLFFFMIVSYAGALLKPTVALVYYAIIIVATLCLVAGYIERGKERNVFSESVPVRGIAIKCWLVATPAFLATAYVVAVGGGISGYFDTLDERLIRFEGQGFLMIMVKAAPSIQTAYFALLFTTHRVSKVQWTVFGVFTILASLAAVVSGSRNTLLVMFLVMAICASFRQRGGVSIKAGAVGVVIGLSLLIILEDVRNRASDLTRGFDDSPLIAVADSKSLRYGVIPLEMIERTEYSPLLYGRTFVASITNFVPRTVWPGKPDGAGEEYTKYYFGTLWAGSSRDSPGIFAESVMNFGRAGGVVVAFAILFFSFAGLARAYSALREQKRYSPALVLLYAYGVIFAGNLPFAEFATAVMNFVTRGLLAAGVAWVFSFRYSIGPRH
ncbi:hypothetical protein [Arenimonas alkanexedens]